MKKLQGFLHKYHVLVVMTCLILSVIMLSVPKSSYRDMETDAEFVQSLQAASVPFVDMQQLAISLAMAAPGDVEIILVIPAAKAVDFQLGFLAKCPIPLIEDMSDPNNIVMVSEYTPKQWITEWLRRQATRAYRHGKIMLAQQSAIVDPDIM